MKDYDVKVPERRKRPTDMPDWWGTVEPYVDWLDRKLGWRFWAVVSIVLVSLVVGTPHMLVTYMCYGRCGHPSTVEYGCNYIGIRGWKTAEPDEGTRKCPRFLLM